MSPRPRIQLAPPTVGAVAYLSVGSGAPDLVVHALLGYGLLQAALLLRLLPWIMWQPFAVSCRGFTVGATALATAALKLVGRGDVGAVAQLTPVLFAGANVLVGLIALATLWLVVRGRLLPQSAPAPAPTARA